MTHNLKISGEAHIFGDNIDTDVIISAQHMASTDPNTFAKYCMEPIDPTFAERVNPGDVMFCGENFGCGSSREHAPIAIKAIGISWIIGKSFARIFYRNAFNIGLPLIISPQSVKFVQSGDLVQVNYLTGNINVRGRDFKSEPIPEFMQEILSAGGLLEYLRLKRTNDS